MLRGRDAAAQRMLASVRGARGRGRARLVSALLHLLIMSFDASPQVRQYPEVREYMTHAFHTIGPNQSLAAARRLMREQDVRHLPVLDGGAIVGLLSERDRLVVESLPGVNPTDVRVEEAMVQDVFTVAP